jgi:hypothetical protein
MKNNEITRNIEQQIATLNRRKEMILKLQEQRDKIEAEIQKVSGGQVTSVSTTQYPERKKRELPRGVLTVAAFTVLRKSNKPMHVKDIVEGVKSSPIIDEHVENLDKKVRGILNTSDHFENIGKGTFKLAQNELRGKLFERLTATAA